MPFGIPTTMARLVQDYLARTGARLIPADAHALQEVLGQQHKSVPLIKGPRMSHDETSETNEKRYTPGAERGKFDVLSPKYPLFDTEAVLPLEVTLNIQLRTKGNGGYRHRYAESKHIRAQRRGVYNALCALGSPHLLTGNLTITITRIAPRLLGKTNPVLSAAKHVVDGIADYLTSKPGKGHYYDDSPRFTWDAQQERGMPGEYAVHIRIEETHP